MNSLAPIVFFVCHGGPADHFATFADVLEKEGKQVIIYASGPALNKLRDRNDVVECDVEKGLNLVIASCGKASFVISDVGHAADIVFQERMQKEYPLVRRAAYYDNPEAFVPGGYSETAAKVMALAEKTLFANANLAMGKENSVGLGFYPVEQGEKIKGQRESSQRQFREELFEKIGRRDEGQPVIAYMGGNNEVYFKDALPAFLRALETSGEKALVLFQQHPGAKKENRDRMIVEDWLKGDEKRAEKLIVSDFTTDYLIVLADQIAYYQTSMGPQFALAKIPTIQIGHEVYRDVLVRNGIAKTVVNGDEFGKAVQMGAQDMKMDEIVKDAIGYCKDWQEKLVAFTTDGSFR